MKKPKQRLQVSISTETDETQGDDEETSMDMVIRVARRLMLGFQEKVRKLRLFV